MCMRVLGQVVRSIWDKPEWYVVIDLKTNRTKIVDVDYLKETLSSEVFLAMLS